METINKIEETKKKICKMSDVKVISFLAAVVGVFTVIGISSDETQETINSRNGLEQCIIKDGDKWQGEPRPKVIWVKDCAKTLKAVKDTK